MPFSCSYQSWCWLNIKWLWFCYQFYRNSKQQYSQFINIFSVALSLSSLIWNSIQYLFKLKIFIPIQRGRCAFQRPLSKGNPFNYENIFSTLLNVFLSLNSKALWNFYKVYLLQIFFGKLLGELKWLQGETFLCVELSSLLSHRKHAGNFLNFFMCIKKQTMSRI